MKKIKNVLAKITKIELEIMNHACTLLQGIYIYSLVEDLENFPKPPCDCDHRTKARIMYKSIAR